VHLLPATSHSVGAFEFIGFSGEGWKESQVVDTSNFESLTVPAKAFTASLLSSSPHRAPIHSEPWRPYRLPSTPDLMGPTLM